MNRLIALSISFLFLAACSQSSSHRTQPVPEQFLYVLNAGDETISEMKIESDGSVTKLSNPLVSTGYYPRAMIMDRSHRGLYVANWGEDTISQFHIGTDGKLTEVATKISTGAGLQNLTVSPDGRFLYAMSMSDGINQFSIASDGSLALVATTPMTDSPVSMEFSKSGRYAYVVSMGITDITQFAVNSDGTLSALSPATVPSAGCPSGPLTTTQSVFGQENLYVLSCGTDQIEVYGISNVGTLTSKQVISTGAWPVALTAMDSNIYVVNLGDSNVSGFSIGANGTLQSLSQTAYAGQQPENMVVESSGQFAYTVDFVGDQLFQLSRDRNGQVTSSDRAPVTTGSAPYKAVIF